MGRVRRVLTMTLWKRLWLTRVAKNVLLNSATSMGLANARVQRM